MVKYLHSDELGCKKLKESLNFSFNRKHNKYYKLEPYKILMFYLIVNSLFWQYFTIGWPNLITSFLKF